MKGRVLVAGFATRHVAWSAFRAGYEVCAVDHFCDQDLTWYTRERVRFEELEDLPDAIDTISRQHHFDIFIATSGAEDLPTLLPRSGTPREKIGQFMDKLETQHFFENLRIDLPRIAVPGEYPAMIKPRRGAGGWRNAVIHDEDERAGWEARYPGVPYILQEFVTGLPASVCCITDGERARAVATNEQVLRGSGESSFGFCGSITPCNHPLAGRMVQLAETAAAASGCTGTIGIDFVLGDFRPSAIEINPRFQGTMDTVEMACGCSLFQYHVDACAGTLPAPVPPPNQVAIRSILFADRDMTISRDLRNLAPDIADIPWPGTFFEEGQALLSVYGTGPDRSEACAMLDKHISRVLQYIR
ncbi:MAG: hypothetical protein METHP_02089 [Methanoregula sp. SKADARSKE-2]|nr:MAG: hypothetical protein METHP_02089 [Methanoregula sp. SKADARSKE-2]